MNASPRTCYRGDGKPKVVYASFDEAMDAVASNTYGERQHAYRCPYGCGWHCGRNRSVVGPSNKPSGIR